MMNFLPTLFPGSGFPLFERSRLLILLFISKGSYCKKISIPIYGLWPLSGLHSLTEIPFLPFYLFFIFYSPPLPPPFLCGRSVYVIGENVGLALGVEGRKKMRYNFQNSRLGNDKMASKEPNWTAQRPPFQWNIIF